MELNCRQSIPLATGSFSDATEAVKADLHAQRLLPLTLYSSLFLVLLAKDVEKLEAVGFSSTIHTFILSASCRDAPHSVRDLPHYLELVKGLEMIVNDSTCIMLL